MFRDQRLGEISADVLDYLSSREADRRIFEADLLVDRAHLVMLREQGLISGEVCSQIMAALDEIGADEASHDWRRRGCARGHRGLRPGPRRSRRRQDAHRPLSQRRGGHLHSAGAARRNAGSDGGRALFHPDACRAGESA